MAYRVCRLLAFIFASALGVLAFGRTSSVPIIPAGTPVNAQIADNLSSENSKTGQVFRGTLANPVVVNGRVVFPKGTDVKGRVVKAQPSGRLSEPGVLELSLLSIGTGKSAVPVTVQKVVIKGVSHTKNNVTKIGGGAAAGGILGAIFGGGKGAAIGAGVGAAGGTAAAAATGKRPARVESEAVLTWVIAQNVATSNGAFDQNSDASGRYSPATYRGRHGDDEDDQGEDDEGRDSSYYFNDRDRRIIRSCLYDSRSGLPPGLAKKDRLPPGLEKQLQRNGNLPPGLQKRVQPLPYACEERLVHLPHDWARVILSGRVVLLDPGRRIVDLFWLGEGDD